MHKLDADLASRIVWFDGYVTNVDRTRAKHQHADVAPAAVADRSRCDAVFPSRARLGRGGRRARDPFALIKTHVLLRHARALDAVDPLMADARAATRSRRSSAGFPELADGGRRGPAAQRSCAAAYVRYLRRRLAAPRPFVAEAAPWPPEYTYDYAIMRVVPRVERGEQINVGVILSCVDDEFLDARIELDSARLLALDPSLDVDAIRAGLATIPAVCAGGADAGRSAKCRRASAFAGWCRRAAP